MRKLLEEFGLIVVAVLVILTVAVTAVPISKDVKDTENKILDSAYENYQKQGSAAVPYDEDNAEFMLSINKGNGIKTVSGAGTYRKGEQITVIAEVKIGYTFAGWTGDLESQQVEFKFTMPAGDVNLTANAIVNTYTIKYDGNGADGGSTASSTHAYDEEKVLTANGYTRAGCSFIGWNTKADGSGTKYTNEATIKNLALGGEITLYAQWEGAFAVYSETDNSLVFYDDVVPIKGSIYSGKTVTEIYTGVESLKASSASKVLWNKKAGVVKTVNFVDEIKPINISYWFYDMSSCVDINLEKLDTSNVTSLKSVFYNCSSLTELDVSGLDTSNTTSIRSMFSGCSSLEELDVSNFVTDKVTDMAYVFKDTTCLTEINVSNFNTSKVTTMLGMFYGCTNVKELDVSNFVTDNVTNLSLMFYNCNSLSNLDVSGFNTAKNTTIRSMFNGCSNVKELDVSNFVTDKVTDMAGAFKDTPYLTKLDVSNFNTSMVTSMKSMFYNCSNVESIDVSGFDTSNVTDMNLMFYRCSTLGNLDVTGFDTSNVTDMRSMFNECSSLKGVDVSNFNTSNVTDMTYMFDGCRSLTFLDLSSFDTTNVNTKFNMFNNCLRLKEIKVSDKFHFIGETIETIEGVGRNVNDLFPTPNKNYISGADGNWYNIETGVGYDPADIPSNTAATYVVLLH